MNAELLVPLVVTAVTLGALGIGVLYLLLAQFRMRGQGWVSWLLLMLAGSNPIYPLILLVLLPNKRRAALRGKFADELDAKLAAATPPAAVATVAFPQLSVGDLPTANPDERPG